MGVDRLPTVVSTATAKRRDSVEDEFDIVTDDEVRDIMNERYSNYIPKEAPAPVSAPVPAYPQNLVYPGTSGLYTGPNVYSNAHPHYLPSQFHQPAPTYYPPGYNNPYNQPQVVNWAFGKPMGKRVRRNQFGILSNIPFLNFR